MDEGGRLLNASRSFGERRFAREMLEISHCIKTIMHFLENNKLGQNKHHLVITTRTQERLA